MPWTSNPSCFRPRDADELLGDVLVQALTVPLDGATITS
jgi:hypothetical protein